MEKNNSVDKFNIIQEGTSLILSYNFLYEEESLKEGFADKTIIDNNLIYENLLNYIDRLYEKNKIFYFEEVKGKNLYLYENGKVLFNQLKIEDIYILFFENNMAFLNIKLEYNGKDLEELYKINKHLTTFYTKADSNFFIAIGDENFDQLTMPIEDFKKYLSTKDEKYLIEFTKEKEELFNSEKFTLENKAYNYKIIKKANIVSINLDEKIDLYKDFLEFYSPEKNKDYPFDKKVLADFKNRVGPTQNEKTCIMIENEKDDFSNVNQHYLYFENQEKITEQRRKNYKLRYIDYNTFITSLILKYIKPNDGVLFYDNFNFISTNYINSYITLSCESEMINNSVENNFLSFEPLISSKVKRGTKITSPDFFKTYQSQADMFTIGNSHNIVHILDDSIDKSIMNRKVNDHFYTYQLSQLQRNSILRIITTSILNINDIASGNSFFSRLYNSWKTFNMISNSVKNFTKYLTNINFSVISNSSSMDNSYQFFRECNEVNLLTSQWGSVSFKLKDSKTVINFILTENRSFFLIITSTILVYAYWSQISKIISYFGF